MPRKKETVVATETLGESSRTGRPQDFTKDAKAGVELLDAMDMTQDAIELEAFMNEVLTIVVHESTDEEALDVPMPSVNGINQLLVRGREQQVKRKYVEALARARTTTYVQEVPDATRPEQILMKEKTVVSDPFSVIHDPNPLGRPWLQSILAQK